MNNRTVVVEYYTPSKEIDDFIKSQVGETISSNGLVMKILSFNEENEKNDILLTQIVESNFGYKKDEVIRWTRFMDYWSGHSMLFPDTGEGDHALVIDLKNYEIIFEFDVEANNKPFPAEETDIKRFWWLSEGEQNQIISFRKSD